MGDDSPKNKVKFLCSYGGKVLPRPYDGVLKYVGGETRVICIPRDITFSEMMKKVCGGMVDTAGAGEVVLKYQLVPEDLDALVSVRTEEDLKHMIEEYDRHESEGAPLLRAFLFPSRPVHLVDHNNNHHQAPPVPSSILEPYLLEQRYIDAVNGIIRTSPRGSVVANKQQQQLITSTYSYSACCSPKSNSPDGHTTVDSPFHPYSHQAGQLGLGLRNSMHKVHSSPSLSNLTANNNQPPPPPPHDIHSHCHHHLTHTPAAYPSSPSTSSSQIGGMAGRPPPLITDNYGRSTFNYYYSSRPQHRGGGGSGGGSGNNYAYSSHDDCTYGGGHVMQQIERVHSVPRSPRKTIWE